MVFQKLEFNSIQNSRIKLDFNNFFSTNIIPKNIIFLMKLKY